jgi:hypothetical protein
MFRANQDNIANSTGYAVTSFGSSANTNGIYMEGSYVRMSSGDVSSASSHGIKLINSFMNLRGAVSGTSNGGYGCYAISGSGVYIRNGSAPTLTGTSGNAYIGATATTWAGVDGGTPVWSTTQMSFCVED